MHRTFGFAIALACWMPATQSAEPERRAYEPELPTRRSQGKLAIRSLRPSTASVGQFEKFELTLDISATFDNPFDPDQVDVRARFTSPSGKAVEVFGFFYQPYRNRHEADDAKSPMLDAAGEPSWKIRFTPVELGRHTFQVKVRDRSGQVESRPGTFRVVPSNKRGFVRVSKRNGRYFEFDDGTPFFAIGQNIQNDWPRYRHSRLLAESGCNAARAWVFCHWSWLEWTFKPDCHWAGSGHWMRSYGGAGDYNQRIAWIADHHLERWTRDGLFVMFCMGAGELHARDRYDSWGGNPYNAANGGFLKKPTEFWTDERARKLYKQRLRYIVARYGYSTNVWAWEFWNELGKETDHVVAWQAEMARCLREIDINRHLITTSHWGTNAEANSRTWAIPQIDFTQTHIYAGASTIRARTRRMLRLSPKPHIVGEGGGPSPGKDCSSDPDGIDFHNSLWAAAMSGAAGTTLPWWWRQRIEPKNLFFHYAAIARFAKTVPWNTEPLQPIERHTVHVSAPPAGKRFGPVLFVPLGTGWGAKAPRNRFRVEPDGAVAHLDEFGGVLFGKGRAEWANPPTIEVTYPAAGRFILHVSEVSHAVLEIELDGETVLRDDALNVSRNRVRRDFVIEVPAGRHEITLRNAGADWLRIGHIMLTNYRDSTKYPDIDAYGLQSERMAVLWFHHRLNEWTYRSAGVEPKPIAGAKATVRGLADRDYRVQWWDTYKPAITKTEQRPCRNGLLEIDLPTIQTDAACVVRPVP